MEVGADRVVRQPGSPNFAGSALTMDRAVANFAEMASLPLADAWDAGDKRVACYATFGSPGSDEGDIPISGEFLKTFWAAPVTSAPDRAPSRDGWGPRSIAYSSPPPLDATFFARSSISSLIRSFTF